MNHKIFVILLCIFSIGCSEVKTTDLTKKETPKDAEGNFILTTKAHTLKWSHIGQKARNNTVDFIVKPKEQNSEHNFRTQVTSSFFNKIENNVFRILGYSTTLKGCKTKAKHTFQLYDVTDRVMLNANMHSHDYEILKEEHSYKVTINSQFKGCTEMRLRFQAWTGPEHKKPVHSLVCDADDSGIAEKIFVLNKVRDLKLFTLNGTQLSKWNSKDTMCGMHFSKVVSSCKRKGKKRSCKYTDSNGKIHKVNAKVTTNNKKQKNLEVSCSSEVTPFIFTNCQEQLVNSLNL